MSDNFAHHLRLDRIRDGDRIDLVADEAEREAIAERLGLQIARPARGACHARPQRRRAFAPRAGSSPSLDQSCVVTGEPVAGACRRAVRDRCSCPSRKSARSEEEIELGAAECDVVFHDGSTIDLGAAIADTLALGLDPYPRSAGAEAALKEAGVLTEAEAGPFAALAELMKGTRRSS